MITKDRMILKGIEQAAELDQHAFPENRIAQMYLEVSRLKDLYRQGFIKRDIPGAICESVAEHCFTVGIMSYFAITENNLSLDPNKALLMGMIHEFGEVYAGDIIPTDNITEHQKRAMEINSVNRVLDGLKKKDYYFALWDDFDRRLTPEGLFVSRVDKLDMMMQAEIYKRTGNTRMEDFYRKKTHDHIVGDSTLADILNNYIDTSSMAK